MPGVGDVEAADDDVVRVQRLGDADGGGAAGAEVGGQAEVVEGVLAVVAADGEEAGGGEALVEGVGEGVADPVEGGWPERLSKGRTRTRRPGGGGVGGLGVQREAGSRMVARLISR